MTDTQNKEEWEGPPLDPENEEGSDNPQPQSTSPTGEGDSPNAVNNRESHEDDETSTSRAPAPEENKENVDRTSQQSSEKDPAQNAKGQPENTTGSRGRSRSRPTRRRSTKPSKVTSDQRDGGDASTTAVSSPEKNQSLPAVYEDEDAANKGQLVKRNRRRNRKSGYESSATEDMPLRERQYPPQQQQMQQQQQQAPAKKTDAIKLRLDLNLDIEVELKARIHGDLTLSLF